ncbi:MAG: carbohydrate-binding family 9-like protein [Chitinophagaceae bacterium]
MNRLVIISVLLLLINGANAQVQSADGLAALLRTPLQYTVVKTADKITVDGKQDEKVWQQAKWTADFTDLETGVFAGMKSRARCKLLWDDTYLYVYAEINEENLWASLREHDSQVFQDNALEIFICPRGNNFNYVEFQINGFETVWDLFLTKPYRNGGKGLTNWDIKGLKKAVHLNGTLNNSNDTDTGWSIELAIPLNAVLMNNEKTPKAGDIWRMNFSSVQWKLDVVNGKYNRRTDKLTGEPLPPQYSVWSPHGILNLHYPERWGYVLFSDEPRENSFLSEEEENVKHALWKYYYLQQQFKSANKKYASSLKELDTFNSTITVPLNEDKYIQMNASDYQFWLSAHLPGHNEEWAIDNTGEFHINSKP